MPKLQSSCPLYAEPASLCPFAIASVAAMTISWCHPLAAHPTASEERTIFELDTLAVAGRANDLTGVAESASRGQVGPPEFEFRPLLRTGELLEVVPGLLATQHSGSGKANQYYLRGFNLDHGTDFSAHIDGVPLNLRTHGHGQGYLDLNGIIPEFIETIEYGKGPYYPEIGDFSSAGYAQFHTIERLSRGFVKLSYGEHDYYRLVAGNSVPVGGGDLLLGLETHFQNGPWNNEEHTQKYNGLLKYTRGDFDNGFSLIATAYSNRWNATDQIPGLAVDRGLITELDTIDPSDGGDIERYSLAANWWRKNDQSETSANFYAFYSDLNLYSNFTFFLDDPKNGDQIQQKDRRVTVGGDAAQTWYDHWHTFDVANTVGLQIRFDHIPAVALYHTQQRRRLSVTSEHRINETSVSIYAKNEIKWLEKLRTIVGARADFFVYDINDRLHEQNSGNQDAAILSPKFSLILGPWYRTEYYLNLGYGYHSNDARGITLRTAPTNGETIAPANPLVWSRGTEIGLRSALLPGLTSTLAVWWLQLDSELVFVGDAGTTEPSGKSERYGVEWSNYYQPTPWLTLDADLAFTKARFSDAPRGQDRVPNSVGRVITAGATVSWPNGLFGTLRLRHFGDIPLSEDGLHKAASTNLVNFGTGYRIRHFKLAFDILNLLDSNDADISYYYASRLPGEAAEGIEDNHFHPVLPRTFRVSLRLNF